MCLGHFSSRRLRMHDFNGLCAIHQCEFLPDDVIRPTAARRPVFHASGSAREFNATANLINRDEQFPTIPCCGDSFTEKFLACFRHPNLAFF